VSERRFDHRGARSQEQIMKKVAAAALVLAISVASTLLQLSIPDWVPIPMLFGQ
jgi:hypothetical protein